MSTWIRNIITSSGDGGVTPSGPAPDVVDFEAGNFDVATGTFSATLEYDTLKEEIIIETRCKLPASLANWSAVRFVFRIPNGDDFDYAFEGDPYTTQAFAPPEPGGVMIQTLTLSGTELPEPGTTIRVIANSFNAAGESNRDNDDLPTGPYVDLQIPTEEERLNIDRPAAVSDLAFTVSLVTDAIGEYEVTATMTPPNDGLAIGVQIYIETPQNTTPRDMGIYDFQGTGTQSFKFRVPAPRGAGAVPWKLWAVTYSKFFAQPLMTSGPYAAPFYVLIVGAVSAVDAALKIVNGVLGVNNGGITEDLIGTFAVSSAKIKDAAIATSKIADGVITTVKIADRSVSALKLGLLAVETANIADAAITTAKIQNLAITNALIANAAITDAKIGDVSANKITAGTITASVLMTSPSLLISGVAENGVNQTIQVNSTNSIKITESPGSTYTRITVGEVVHQSTTNADRFCKIETRKIELRDGAPNTGIILDPVARTISIDGKRVVNTRTSAIADPSGGSVVDTQARTAIVSILAALEWQGIIES